MEQVLTRLRPLRGHPAAPLRTSEIAERLLRCALIEEAAALAGSHARAGDPALLGILREHAAADERHAARLRALAGELTEPARNGAGRPDADLVQWLRLLSRARGEVEGFAGLYGVVKILLADAYRDLIAAASEDRSLLSSLREMLREEERMIEWGWERLRDVAAAPASRADADDWAEYLRMALRAAGDVWGDMPRAAPPYRPGLSDR